MKKIILIKRFLFFCFLCSFCIAGIVENSPATTDKSEELVYLKVEFYSPAAYTVEEQAQTFRLVTFPMSKPILAVIALGAFNMAYGGFMWAFLTCQNPKMWTLMVWLYDFQSRYSTKPGLVMAALTLASIPTLLVFLFCQKIIMRGIIIPTMK